MGVRERMMICRVVEQIEKQKSYSRRLGIKNVSTYRGRAVDENLSGGKRRNGQG